MFRRHSLLAGSLALFGAGLIACGDVGPAADLASDTQLQAAHAALDSGNAARLSEARQGFELVLEADPSSIEARLGLAESARRLGDSAAAERAFEEVLGLGGDRSTVSAALQGLAALRREHGDEAGAADLDAQAEALSEDTAAR